MNENEPVRVTTIKPAEQHYYTTILRTVMEFYPTVRHKIHKLEETTYYFEYQNTNLWFDPEIFAPPIFGKFEFLKDMK